VNHGDRILVVDDEAALRDLVRPYLEADGCLVVDADTGPAGLRALEQGGVDLAVVDVMLPGFDGLELVRRARIFSKLPIILLTARREEGSRIAGLGVGADDYVLKPFSAPELVARVSAQLRRARGFSSPATLRLAGIEIHPQGRLVLVRGEEVNLTRREFDLLWALVTRPGKVMTRTELLREAWETVYVSDKTIDVHLAGLRRKLGPGLRVRAIRGIGYRLDPT
jgi:two-component system response regulator ResD